MKILLLLLTASLIANAAPDKYDESVKPYNDIGQIYFLEQCKNRTVDADLKWFYFREQQEIYENIIPDSEEVYGCEPPVLVNEFLKKLKVFKR